MNTSLLTAVSLTAGTMALIIAFVAYQIHQMQWLKHHGRRIVAMVTSIRHEMGKTSAGFTRDNYYVTATWTHPRTGKTYTFWTWMIDRVPNYEKGSLVPVLIDPNHPERFAMDL
ncbi:MAG TPA: DUF3592 domain-containing protein [Ktedonobacteraceae bacterium]|nr:DUF3592 domain-containing protein [Ktedonobacteraceae bacterium]